MTSTHTRLQFLVEPEKSLLPQKSEYFARYNGQTDVTLTAKSDIREQVQFIDKGGNVLIMLGEGGEAKYGTNINFLLEEYGIMINSDAVCR